MNEGDWTEKYELPREAAARPRVLPGPHRPEYVTIRVTMDDALALLAGKSSVRAIRAAKDAVERIRESVRKAVENKGRMNL